MSGGYWDRYGRYGTLCHRLPAVVKVLLALLVITVGLSLPVGVRSASYSDPVFFWPLHALLLMLVFVGQTLARIPLRYLLRRLGLFLPMVMLLSLSVPLSQGFSAGWEVMAAILFRSTLAFLSIVWLVNVMPFEQLLATLRRLKCPAVFVAMLAFMYRYSFVVWDELSRMRTARRARAFRTGSVRWRESFHLIGLLLIRAMERAERVHGAMCARGWDGQVRTYTPPALPTPPAHPPWPAKGTTEETPKEACAGTLSPAGSEESTAGSGESSVTSMVANPGTVNLNSGGISLGRRFLEQ